MRSPASSPRPTAGWRLKTYLWPTSSATSASLEPSPMAPGPSSLVSFDTRRRGSGRPGGMRPLVSLDQDLFEVWQGRAADGVGDTDLPLRWLRAGHGPRLQRRRESRRLGRGSRTGCRPGPGPPSRRPVAHAPGGKALAIASAVVKPAPVNGEPTLRHPLGPRTPEKGGVRLPR